MTRKKQEKQGRPLDRLDVATLKAARKILRRLRKEARAWDGRIDRMIDRDGFYDATFAEQDRMNKWLDGLYRSAKVDFDYDYGFAFVDVD